LLDSGQECRARQKRRIAEVEGMIDLSGRRALVCGSSQGIGRAAAELLAKAGASVALLARDAAVLEQVRRGLARVGQAEHVALVADFRDPSAVGRVAREHVASAGAVEILVNNTGGPAPGAIVDAEPEEFVAALTMHVLCNHALVQALLPGMKQRGYGRIINIISTSVREPIANLGVSNTTRAAVAAWAKTLAGEVGPFGITVNNVLPGFTQTARLDALIRARAEKQGTSVAQVEEAMKAAIPLRRFAAPAEIAAAVVFLASPLASYVNGVSLPVDGGRIGGI
jgi:3-oxoacyl-[acyl-carrier protein] reductase